MTKFSDYKLSHKSARHSIYVYKDTPTFVQNLYNNSHLLFLQKYP